MSHITHKELVDLFGEASAEELALCLKQHVFRANPPNIDFTNRDHALRVTFAAMGRPSLDLD